MWGRKLTHSWASKNWYKSEHETTNTEIKIENITWTKHAPNSDLFICQRLQLMPPTEGGCGFLDFWILKKVSQMVFRIVFVVGRLRFWQKMVSAMNTKSHMPMPTHHEFKVEEYWSGKTTANIQTHIIATGFRRLRRFLHGFGCGDWI
jgi:hypothetical protein